MTHIMIDLETWGTRPGCDIRSIGATVFDPSTGHIGERGTAGTFYIATDNPALAPLFSIAAAHKYPLTRDDSTVEWWSRQSDEAQAAFTNPVDLREALQTFKLWLGAMSIDNNDGHGERLKIWAHGPTFDVSILAAAYEAVFLPIPWHYRAPRDTRTIMEAAGMDPHKGLEQFTTGTFHHALDDAICQAGAVCEAYRRLQMPATSQDGNKSFASWSTETLVRQCRMQARDQLDPQFSDFLAEVADRLAAQPATFPDEQG